MDITDERKKALRECRLFKGLDQPQLDVLEMHARRRSFSEGDIVYTKGMQAQETFCLVLSGSVNIVGDKGQIVQTLESGEVMGEIATVSPQRRRTVTVKAVEDTEVLEWDFKDLQEEIPELTRRLKDLAWKRTTDRYW